MFVIERMNESVTSGIFTFKLHPIFFELVLVHQTTY